MGIDHLNLLPCNHNGEIETGWVDYKLGAKSAGLFKQCNNLKSK